MYVEISAFPVLFSFSFVERDILLGMTKNYVEISMSSILLSFSSMGCSVLPLMSRDGSVQQTAVNVDHFEGDHDKKYFACLFQQLTLTNPQIGMSLDQTSTMLVTQKNMAGIVWAKFKVKDK